MELEPVPTATFPRLSSTSSCKDKCFVEQEQSSLHVSLNRKSSTRVSKTLVLRDCAICLETSEESDLGFVKLKRCGHVFHQACVDEWLSKHNTCPLCRRLASLWQHIQYLGPQLCTWPKTDAEKSVLLRRLNATSSASPVLKDKIKIADDLNIVLQRAPTFFERLKGRQPKPTCFSFTQVKEFHHVVDGLVFVCDDASRKGADRCMVHLCRFRSVGDARSTFDAVVQSCHELARQMRGEDGLMY
eukprot:TRINITY_DN9392_c0_g1_i3.p1 TRINITY_DN9392_c0_g1~~TRINITY_DN9392_c0_g1_i3.p1  ORF type:complete len:244 (+),score=35.65 TRINITY_DN9392_c0_g1_i3:163-894(+)